MRLKIPFAPEAAAPLPSTAVSSVRIGLDLDGTIALYDKLFHAAAAEAYGLPGSVPVRKEAVREWLRASAGGERAWVDLQSYAYGPGMVDAVLADGLADALCVLRAAGVAVSIVSHKTRFSAGSPRADLHAAALAWLEAQGCFDPSRLGLDRDRVFFEPSRAAKLARISAEGCALFVDDLPEVLLDPAFPSGVERWLFVRADRPLEASGVVVFSDWRRLASRGRELAEAARAA